MTAPGTRRPQAQPPLCLARLASRPRGDGGGSRPAPKRGEAGAVARRPGGLAEIRLQARGWVLDPAPRSVALPDVPTGTTPTTPQEAHCNVGPRIRPDGRRNQGPLRL